MIATAHIMVVDDDPEIRQVVGDYLTESGYRVSTAEDGETLRRAMAREGFDLILLDLNLPGEDGFSLMPQLRRVSQAGIIILTGRGEKVDEVVGLELGADDYVSKPCDLRHLAARIRAVLRRTAGSTQAEASSGGDDIVTFEGWSLNRSRRTLTSPSGVEVRLTAAEFNLLAIFAVRPGRTLSRAQLSESLHGREWSPYDRSIDNLVSRLRKKLGDVAGTTDMIRAVRGVGYVFAGGRSVQA